jgi:hypothetical protein
MRRAVKRCLKALRARKDFPDRLPGAPGADPSSAGPDYQPPAKTVH